MPYDQMTDNEAQDYQELYQNPPMSLRGRAERFIALARKGWGNTRAADDCFENNNGDAVLLLVLREVKASPELKNLLRDWGYWSKDWEEKLANFKHESMKLIVTEFEWQDITIQLLYRPQWSAAAPGMSHLEIQTVEPERTPLPMTETGFRSHFFQSDTACSETELIENVTAWLEKEASSPKWQAAQIEQQQLTLF